MDMKNRGRGFRRAALLLLAVFVLAFIFASSGIFSAENSLPTKFVNDEPWYDETIYNWVKINSVWFVPVTVFEKLDGVTVKSNKYYQNLMILYGDKYLTIDTATKSFAYTENGMFYFKSYLLRANTLWVPAEPVCDYFGFKLEEYGDAVRISDGTGSKTLPQLLSVYNPSLVTTAPTETTKETTRETRETTQPPSLTTETMTEITETSGPDYAAIGERLIYLTFEDCPNEYTSGVLDLLEKYGVKATFFVTGEIENHAGLVRRMAVDGDAIGLHTMTGDVGVYASDFGKFMSELELENDILYRITKQKTRLVRAPDGSYSDKFVISADEGKKLSEAGYVVWDWNVYIPDSAAGDEAYQTAVDGIINYNIPVIRMTVNQNTAAALEKLLQFITAYDGFDCEAITAASAEVNFIGAFS